MPAMTVVVRTTGDPTAVTGVVRDAIHELDALLPVPNAHALIRHGATPKGAP